MRIFLLNVFLLSFFVSMAQEEKQTDQKIRLGLSLAIAVDSKRNTSDFDKSEYFLVPLSFGGVLKTERFQAKAEVIPAAIDLEIKYYLPKGVFVRADARFGTYIFSNSGIDADQFETYSIGLGKYLLGVGYSFDLGPLMIETEGLFGYAYSNKFKDIFVDFSGTNIRRKVTNTFRFPATPIYGGELRVELKGGHLLSSFPNVSPFFSIQIVGNHKTDAERTVIVEEWIEGNVVFEESSKDSDIEYDFMSTEVEVGFKYFF